MLNIVTAFRVKNKGVMELLTLMATLKVKTGKEAEVAEICAQLAKEVLAKEKDCLMYIPHVVKNDPTEIVFFEKYKDKEAFKVHGRSAYFQAAAQKFEELLEGKIQVKFLEEV
ncbi:putative quinol monooxygenase [Desulfosporosinus meridiei]|uniref:ABM domain-containing protein n=1 Tax=Desulfosporosinus meridiei (strain ATCC BAA-275 / DSM 13257 / KCTC 12902 / NCIMB 13706 / S10) TaxID=768704 RepID=J7ITK9_DESMD|nr:putative quinol monooxygenase [Desulfosporosinus meridiei]AFQ45207.1 hypothetical protein Desmer_3335 [Desulfosporosinus meridiei DSM 13257]